MCGSDRALDVGPHAPNLGSGDVGGFGSTGNGKPMQRWGSLLDRPSAGRSTTFPPGTARSPGIDLTTQGFANGGPSPSRIGTASGRFDVRPWRLRFSRTFRHRGPADRWSFFQEREQAFYRPLWLDQGFSTSTRAGNSFPEGAGFSHGHFDSRRNPMNMNEKVWRRSAFRWITALDGGRP